MDTTAPIPAPAFSNPYDRENTDATIAEGMKPLPLSIRVTEGQDRGVGYALYDIHLSTGSKQWSVSRRYSDFEELRNDLNPMLSDSEQELFPPKHYLHGSKSATVVQERLDKLPEWLMAISRHTAVSLHPHFRAFLALDQHEGDLRNALDVYRSKGKAINSPSSNVSIDGSYSSGTNDIHSEQDPGSLQQISATSTSTSETAEALAQPSAMDPVARTASVTVAAPPPPQAEIAHEEVAIEVNVPRPDITEARKLVDEATRDVKDALKVADRAKILDSQAARAELKSEELAVSARQFANEAAVVSEQRDALLKRLQAEAISAAELEKLAAEKRKAADALAAMANDRDADMRKLESLAESKLAQYNKTLKEAESLTQAARRTHQEAKLRQLKALDEHERAAAEMLRVERQTEAAATAEAIKHAGAAAAAKARTQREVARAAMLKADEEAALAAAHLAAKEEAQCAAEIEVLQERIKELRAKKHDYEVVAAAAQKASAEVTHLAARDAAEIDAQLKAVSIEHETAETAASMAKRAQAEWNTAETLKAELQAKDQGADTEGVRMSLRDFAHV